MLANHTKNIRIHKDVEVMGAYDCPPKKNKTKKTCKFSKQIKIQQEYKNNRKLKKKSNKQQII